MIKYFLFFFVLLTTVSCSRTSYYTTYADGKGDHGFYINTDLKVSIHQEYLSRLYPRFKPQKNSRILNKSVKLHQLKMRSEILLYTEGFDKDKDGSLVEYYPSGLSEKKLFRKLKRRNFLKLHKDKDGLIRYEKEVNGYEYYFGERLEQLEKGTVRLVGMVRKGKSIMPNMWTKEDLSDYDRRVDSSRYSDDELDYIEALYRKGMREWLWSYKMSFTNKLPEDMRFNEMNDLFFQEDLQYNYSRLNSVLNNALNDSIAKGDKESHIRAQTLLSYLSRNEDIAKLETSKPVDVDFLISDSDILPVDDLFAQLKEQDTRLLMINETPYWSQCRYQASKLLDSLKEHGFNTIFLEGVSNYKVIGFVEDIENDIGIYSVDPTFGNFLKKAVSLGFIIYGYDVQPVDIERRSELQAENIIKIINDKELLKPDSRAIVYYGSQGALSDNGRNSLVSQLKNKLEERVLSIDQTVLIGSEEIVIKKKSLAKNKTYLVRSNGLDNGGYDYYLFESNDSCFSNTPDYVYNLGEFEIDIKKYFTPEVSLISIYTTPSHGRSTIPIFICTRENKRDSLRLSKGTYYVRRFNDKGQVVEGEKLNVK